MQQQGQDRPVGHEEDRLSEKEGERKSDSRRKTIATRPRDRKTLSGRSGSRFLPDTLALRNPVAAVAEERDLSLSQ